VVANLDVHFGQTGWVELDLPALGIAPGSTLELADLLSGERYRWRPGANYVALDPAAAPAHIFAVRWVAP
jgi:starch synthase (maltosyl-transferring)